MKEFRAAPGAQFTDEKAQTYGEAIEALQKKLGTIVSPADVLLEARKKRCTLHDFFEWDDSIAGEKYRLHQARQLVNHIELVIVDAKGEEQTTAAFLHVKLKTGDDEISQGYLSEAEVWKDKDLAAQVVERAMREAVGFRDRYRQYEALAKINQAITETAERLHIGSQVAMAAL